jgi:putative spermidine/putrescine transport system ATP-binding protein
VQLREEIRRIQTELEITTVFVTHDQEEALAIADRVAVMRDGVIEQIGTPEELYAAPASSFVANFVGLSNRVPAVVSSGMVELYGEKVGLLGDARADGPVTAFVRPEDVVIGASGTPGIVVTSSFLGSLRRTSVKLADGTVVAVQHEVATRPGIGDTVHVRFVAHALVVVDRT